MNYSVNEKYNFFELALTVYRVSCID